MRLADDGQSYEITRIVAGDAWDAGADSPLHAVGAEVKIGERIVAVNGQPVSRERPPQSLLVHQAAAKVELTLAGGNGAAATTRTVLVIDDDPTVRDLMQRFLTKEGFSVVLAEGAQAGPPAALFFKNHGVAVGSVLKNASNWLATLDTPFVLGWV